MYKVIVLIGLFSMTAFAGNPALKLSSLKPTQKSGLELAQLQVALISEGDGKVVSTLSGKLGDCSHCIRGAALKGDLGIRLEGKTIESLVGIRKQTLNIELTSCDLGNKLQDNQMTCEFKFRNQPLKLVFTILQ